MILGLHYFSSARIGNRVGNKAARLLVVFPAARLLLSFLFQRCGFDLFGGVSLFLFCHASWLVLGFVLCPPSK